MLLNCSVGENSWESFGLQGDQPSPSFRNQSWIFIGRLMLKLKLQYFGHLMWRTTHWQRPWCWERLKAGGEGDDRGWDGWMASLTQWTWVWVDSGSWWWIGKTGMLQSMGSQRIGHDWVTELTDWLNCNSPGSSLHGISQARILEWVAISFSRGSSWPRDPTCISCTAGRFFTSEPPGKP